jgi:deoxyribodipyrimidine photolyase
MKTSETIQKERIKVLNRKGIQEGKYILYWMQASQRVEYNHALEFAVLNANELRQPLIVFLASPINSQKRMKDITRLCWKG